MKPELVSDERLRELFEGDCERNCYVANCKRHNGQKMMCRANFMRIVHTVFVELSIVQVLEVPESADLLERRHEFAIDEHGACIKGVLRHVKIENGPVLVRVVKEKP